MTYKVQLRLIIVLSIVLVFPSVNW